MQLYDDSINVVYSSDEKYCEIMAVSIVSLFENNKNIKNIDVYCLLNNVLSETKIKLKEIANFYKRELYLIDIKDICNEKRFWNPEEDGRYARLLLSDILNVKKVLYLDCDVMINGAIKSMWNIDVENYLHAAVLDTVRLDARKESKLKCLDNYFNSGVMIINLDKWRAENILIKFEKFKKENNDKGIYNDQRVLNGVSEGMVKIIHPKYNLTPELLKYTSIQITKMSGIERFYIQSEINEAIKQPVIVHFAGRTIHRPWYTNCESQYKDRYRYYMKKFKFTDFELKYDKVSNVIKWKIKEKLPFIFIRLYSAIKNNFNENKES